jgi:AhpD family alkylhydroperoxidase
VDPQLPRFAADLEWLAGKGVSVERFNLAQQPEAFAANGQVKQALEAEGTDCLPLVLVNGVIVSKGTYPEREQLARWARVQEEITKSIYTEAVAELVAIGASIASNCEPCFRYHYDRARKLGVSKEDMALAVNTAQMVKDSPARTVLELADRYLKGRGPRAELPIAGPGGSARKSGCCS